MLNRFFAVRHYCLYSKKLGAVIPAARNDATFQVLSVKDLEKCSAAHEKNRLSIFKRRIKEGHQCYGHVDIESKVAVSYFWVTQGATAPFDFGTEIEVHENEAYIWDCRVVERAQGRGFYQHGLTEISAYLKAEKAYVLSEKRNIKSCNGIKKSGFYNSEFFSLYKILRSTWLRKPSTFKSVTCDTIPLKELE